MNFTNVGDGNVYRIYESYGKALADFQPSDPEKMRYVAGGWEFDVSGTVIWG